MRRLGLPSLLQPPLQSSLTYLACVDELVPAGENFSQILGRAVIQLTIQGEAEITVNDRPMTHRPGRLLAVAKGCQLVERSTKPWHLRYLMFDGPWVEPLNVALQKHGGAVMLDRPPRPWLTALEIAVQSGIDGGAGSAWKIAAGLATLLGGLAADRTEAGDLLSDLGRLIDAAPERAWSVTALAKNLRISPRTLQQRFRSLSALSPARWIHQRRMQHATFLLQRGMAVKDTAEHLGFTNQFHFSRAYKRCCGVSPSVV